MDVFADYDYVMTEAPAVIDTAFLSGVFVSSPANFPYGGGAYSKDPRLHWELNRVHQIQISDLNTKDHILVIRKKGSVASYTYILIKKPTI